MLFIYLFSFYLKDEEGGGTKREKVTEIGKETAHLLVRSLSASAVAMVGPGWSQEPGTQSGTLTWVDRDQWTWFVLSPRLFISRRLEFELQSVLKPIHCDFGIWASQAVSATMANTHFLDSDLAAGNLSYVLLFLFILFAMWRRKIEQSSISWFTPQMCTTKAVGGQDQGQDWNSVWGSQVSDRDSSYWAALTCCLRGCTLAGSWAGRSAEMWSQVFG